MGKRKTLGARVGRECKEEGRAKVESGEWSW